MFDAVTCAIPGGKRASQVADNCKASEIPHCSPEVMASVKRIYDEKIRPLVHKSLVNRIHLQPRRAM